MSKHINVNPDHYKVGGRERQGDAVIQNLERRQFAQQQNQTERWRARHEGPQPWEATAAPSVEEAKTGKRRATKAQRRRVSKTPPRRRRRAGHATNRRAGASAGTRRRRPVARPTKTRRRSQKRRS